MATPLPADDENKKGVTFFATDDYGKQFRRCHRSLELTVHNKTKAATLVFPGEEVEGEYFFMGTWFEHFTPRIIPPGQFSKAFVANKRGAPTGVNGGLKFLIKKTKYSEKYLIIGF